MKHLVLFVWIFLLRPNNALIIDLPNGHVEGITNITRNGTTFHSFLAMRYAEPPVGDLRFELAKPVQPWNGTYDARAEKHVCYQVNENSPKENEDCLFINVFTPKNLQGQFIANLSVMVWIHGGGFISGAGYVIEGGVGPNFFIDYDIVLVAFNYRLGPFGFLSTEDIVLPGNLGLKDQVLALKWVQQNIGYFGGDPKKVTIFGQSAGASSVSYHLLSIGSTGLFRGAIMESGSALCPWAYQRSQRNISFLTAEQIDPNFKGKNSSELLSLLKSVPASTIDSASFVISNYLENAANIQISKGFFYAPVIEVPNENEFISQPMYKIFHDGNYNRVPVIIGINSEESLGLLENGNLVNIFSAYDDYPEDLTPFDLHLKNKKDKEDVGKVVHKFFAENVGFAADLARGIRFHSSHDFDKAIIKQAELQAKYSDVYFYEFTYSGIMGNNHYRLPGTGNVTHAEEVNYIFSKWYSSDIPDNTDLSYFPESDRNVHNRIMTMWTDFSKYLNPSPRSHQKILQNVSWPTVKSDKFMFLEIGENMNIVDDYPKSKQYIFWKNVFNEFAMPPMDTF